MYNVHECIEFSDVFHSMSELTNTELKIGPIHSLVLKLTANVLVSIKKTTPDKLQVYFNVLILIIKYKTICSKFFRFACKFSEN